jgi:HEAT repeat protein
MLAEQIGADQVVAACVDLLSDVEVDGHIVYALGGPPARWAVDGGAPGADYWRRVWAARGLLWLWDESATPALLRALTDASWRVREMAAKVAARHEVDDALEALLVLRSDRVPRVRLAAARAIGRLTRAGG